MLAGAQVPVVLERGDAPLRQRLRQALHIPDVAPVVAEEDRKKLGHASPRRQWRLLLSARQFGRSYFRSVTLPRHALGFATRNVRALKVGGETAQEHVLRAALRLRSGQGSVHGNEHTTRIPVLRAGRYELNQLRLAERALP